MIRTSVVIPTRNRPTELARCLEALARDFPLDAETILVNDGGSALSATLLARYRHPLRLRVLEIDPVGPAAARNRGLEIARGSVVTFTDDDCRPDPGWVSSLTAGTALDPPRAAGGRTRNGLPHNGWSDAAQLILELVGTWDRVHRGGEHFFASNNLAFPIQPLRRLGGFDESFRTGEDRELCRRWAGRGYRLSAVDAGVAHESDLGLRRFVGQFYRYGRGAARFHASGDRGSLRSSIRFHLALPRLLGPEVRRRGSWRGTLLVGRLVLWELANLAGFVAARRHPRPSPALKSPHQDPA